MSCQIPQKVLGEDAAHGDTLITCHSNADFDAFASIIAAQMLYPGAILLFPGTQEKSLNNFYTETATFMYNFKGIGQIEWDRIKRLIIVDTRQNSRIPHVKVLLERGDVEVHIWDHHPPSSDDIESEHCVVESLGATTTLILREIRERNLEISCQDATILGLGIYADTGSFTYASTTTHDYMAAAWLLEKGMDVNTISDLAAYELTSTHIQALHSLLESATSYTVGDDVVVIADVSMEHYLGDFAFLAHKLMEIERFPVLFALGRMGSCITVVARSRSDNIDVGDVCVALGGGGHAYAASASVRNMTIQQVREFIFQRLHHQVQSEKCARDYMSAPALGIEEDKNMHDAYMLMTQLGIKAIPIFKKGTHQCLGVLDAQTASRAVQHHLTEFDTYMQTNVQTLPPDASLAHLIDIIVGARQSLVPIVEDNEVIGVVTRTDLINIFAEKPDEVPITLREGRKERTLIKLMRDRLPKNIYKMLDDIGKLGDMLGMATYAVGGFVRDLLLEQPNYDIDIVVEGNGIAYARELAKLLNGRIREHDKFLTAIVIFKDEFGKSRHIDVATARLEYYQYPAAMPTVELSSLKLDLIRRDFTINALAIRLCNNVFGQLVDFFGGQRDINDRRIRVLHTLSFVEDPSRCLRAVRFEQRYNFKLGAAVEKLIKNTLTLKLMDKLSGARMFHEMRLVFDEPNPVAILQRLDKLGLLPAIHPQLSLNPQKIILLQSLKDILDWYRLLYYEQNPQPWVIYVLGLCHKLNYKDCSTVLQRLGVPNVQQQEFLQLRERVRAARTRITDWHKNKNKRTSDLCIILQSIPIDMLLFIMARSASEKLRKALSRYITTWQHEKIDIDGKDLLAINLPPGPIYGHIMHTVKAAKLDGLASTRESQYALAKKIAAEFMSGVK